MLTMKAYFEAVKFWKENPAEANQIIADGLKFTVPDVELVLGKDGSATDGGIYPFTWTEAAQFMGLTEGVPPFGKNGQISDHWKLTNEWWIKFGLMKETLPPEAGVELGPIMSAVAAMK